ncbi:hypothetical protein HNR23_001251 [Nocardiopsis mwathae]|uniref:Uncharacterized protein n=1 Tax=Nocardiopsis mwathae TaxID=1472723 RepID=A0A7W9YH83_9ACTN|nr:hypothetical protein [Nocardiopsis mwathae]MBB6171191.1 hypothetical protein [Nocardiopsis mwathae]
MAASGRGDVVAGASARRALAAHTSSAMDAYVDGLVLTEPDLPVGAGGSVDESADEVRQHMPADGFPHLVETITDHATGRHCTYGGGPGSSARIRHS